MLQVVLVTALVFAVGIAVFAVQNTAPVAVSFLVWRADGMAASVLVLIAAALGAGLTLLLGAAPEVDQDALEPFARALREDLAAGLDASYRVYLEANHQPKAGLRSAALAAGLNLDAFPRATTMAVTDARVEVSRAALEPYELVHSA